MKNIHIFFASIGLACFASSLFAGNFYQRYGANSHLTNIPLWYNSDYADNVYQESSKCRPENQEVEIVTVTKIASEPKPEKTSRKQQRKNEKKIAKVQSEEERLKIKQLELEERSSKLQEELINLKSKQELTTKIDI